MESDNEVVMFKMGRFIRACGIPLQGTMELKDIAKLIQNKTIVVDVTVDTKSERPRAQVDLFTREAYYTVDEFEEIYELVKVEYPEIGLATVYRTIQLLLELGLIDRINLDDGYVRYEIGDSDADDTKHHHHHLICLNCGKVFSFEDDLLEGLEKKILQTMGFMVSDHEVKLYGCCKECGGQIN